MPAISFPPEFLDALLSGEKQQTTRPVPPDPPKRPRFKVGDIAHIYNQQRGKVIDAPIRELTDIGYVVMERLANEGNYPMISFLDPGQYHAHFLGKVEIAEVYDIQPSGMSCYDLDLWARSDGFEDFNADFCDAETWFRMHYGEKWMQRTWTVIRWDGWLERYFDCFIRVLR